MLTIRFIKIDSVKLVLSMSVNMEAWHVLYGYNTGNNNDNNSNKPWKITEKTKCQLFSPFKFGYVNDAFIMESLYFQMTGWVMNMEKVRSGKENMEKAHP